MAGRALTALKTLKVAGGRTVTVGDSVPELVDHPRLANLIKHRQVCYTDDTPDWVAESVAKRPGNEAKSKADAKKREASQPDKAPKSTEDVGAESSGGFFKKPKGRKKSSATGK